MSSESVVPQSPSTPAGEPDQTTGSTQASTQSHDGVVPNAWADFMRTGWGDRELDLPLNPVAPLAAERRARVAAAFPGERLVFSSGTYKVRSNDADYRFRSDTAHTYLTGNQTSDATLVIEPDGSSVLYARPRSSRETDEFFRDRVYGELWAGRRPSARELSESLNIEVRHVDDLPAVLAQKTPTRVNGVDKELTRVASEARLIKDAWEIDQLREACDATVLGFEDSVADWANVRKYGERWIEGTFYRRARTMGNDVGYDSIVGAGSHATTLHWNENSGQIRDGELLLLDMGVEGHNLYTADVTRTLPTSGVFTSLQRDLYTLVHQAQQAGIEAVVPGAHFRASHNASVAVLAQGLGDMGLLPVSVEEALDESSKVYSRWTLHSVSHMLGMDVHDCAAAAPASYADGTLAEGMVLTVEPGLYFQIDDLLVPEELRGIGIRIEDDIVVTADGPLNLTEALPREAAAIENWMGGLQG